MVHKTCTTEGCPNEAVIIEESRFCDQCGKELVEIDKSGMEPESEEEKSE